LNRTAAGFARRDAGSGGDWQIFPDGSPLDGYGQWGLTEENGGIIMSTTTFVFRAGVYPEMFADFAGLVQALTGAADQLARGAQGAAASPLLAGHRGYLRSTIAAGSIPALLCRNARGLGPSGGPSDRWGDRWCDYYKSVSWNLPEAGAFAFAFVQGLLRLRLPLSSPPPGDTLSVTVYGATIAAGEATEVHIGLPSWAASQWPPELCLATVSVMGLNLQGVSHTLTCASNITVPGDRGPGHSSAGSMPSLACSLRPD